MKKTMFIVLICSLLVVSISIGETPPIESAEENHNNLIIDKFWTLIIAMIVAVITSLLTLLLSLKRFRYERYWDRKYEQYISIFTATHKILHYLYIGRLVITDEHTGSADDINKLTDDYVDTIKEFTKIMQIGSFIISKKAEEIMYRLDDCMVLLTPYIKNIIKDGAVEEYDKISELFSNFLILLRYYAKKDLQPYYYFHKKPNVKIIYSPPHSGLSES